MTDHTDLAARLREWAYDLTEDFGTAPQALLRAAALAIEELSQRLDRAVQGAHDSDAEMVRQRRLYTDERTYKNRAEARVVALEKALVRMCDALERSAEPTHGDIDGWRMSTVQHPREWPMVKDARALLASPDTTAEHLHVFGADCWKHHGNVWCGPKDLLAPDTTAPQATPHICGRAGTDPCPDCSTDTTTAEER